jgi:LemA protein
MYMALLKCERAVSPKEYTQANKRLLLAFMKFEKLKEKYPLLYENEKFASIKDTLIILEEKIAFSKQFYNKEIAEYNKRVFSIPLKVVSSIFNFKLL